MSPVAGSEQLGSLSTSFSAYVRGLEPERLSNDAVLAAFDEVVAIVKVAEAGRALLARVIDDRGLHRRSGHLSAAHLVASASGTTVGAATAVIETGRAMSSHEELDAAFRSGELSGEQAVVVADAVAVDASAERALLEAVKVEGLRGMRAKARAVKAAMEDDRVGRYERQRRASCFRHGIDHADGMVWGQFSLAPDDGAAVINRIERETDRVFREAHRSGRRDPIERYGAEAFVHVVTGGAKASPTTRGDVMVLVSYEALRRGHVEHDEVSVIPGFGDVPIEVSRRLLDEDAFLSGLFHDGERVQLVRRFGRRPSAAVRAALVTEAVLAHGRIVCDVDGCDRADIEWDHTVPWADGGASSPANLTPKCRGHHHAKTLAENQARAQGQRTTKSRRSPPKNQGPAP
jgi:hypothetical protein